MPSFLAVTDWMRQPFTQPISFSSQRRLSCNMSLTLILPTYCHRVILMAWRSQGLLNLLRIYASLHFHYQQPISNHHNLNSCNCIHFCPVQPIVYSACKVMYKNTNLIHLFSGLKPVSNFPWLPDSYYVQKTTACFSSPIFLLSISPLPLVSWTRGVPSRGQTSVQTLYSQTPLEIQVTTACSLHTKLNLFLCCE